jgi:hypothetical protein
MAQMDHCRKGNGRSDTLQWLLAMLTPDQNEDICFALVKGLGTLLKGLEQTETEDGIILQESFEIILVAAKDEPLLLSALKKSANRVVVEAVSDLKAYSDGLMDWVSNESSLIAEGVWPMRHLLHVFCIKTATSGNRERAEKLGQQLFGRVHAVAQDSFQSMTEKGAVVKALEMLCNVIRDDMSSLFLHLLKSGVVLQRARVIQVAAEVSMSVQRESHEALAKLAQALLSDVIEGCTLTDLMQGGSLLAVLLRDESEVVNLRESSKVFRYLIESFGLAAEQGLESSILPKRVVHFLVEFEKHHMADSAAAASRIETVEKKKMNPKEKRKEDKEHSEHLSLKSLAAAVEDFTPRYLSTLIGQPENPLNLYCAARLWATSGLMQERTSEEIAAWLSLSEAMAKEAEDAFTNLQGLKEPWVSGHGCKDGIWLQHVFEGMQDDRRYVVEGMQDDTKIVCLGLLFTSFLKYIREGQRSLNDMSGLERIEETVNQWKPSGRSGPLEQQLLLKELRIGRRVEELRSWTGVVSGNMKDPMVLFYNIFTHTHTFIRHAELKYSDEEGRKLIFILYIYIYTNIYIDACIYIYICIYICMYV